MLINSTYFIGDCNVPNSDTESVIEALNFFIAKYEPELLQKALGYSFYKAFYNGITPIVTEQRWIDLIYGVEYTDAYGNLNAWRGLIETDAPVYSFGSGLMYRTPELIQADATTGFVSGVNTVTFDGTSGKADWRGWEIIPERIGQGTMKKGVDYSWDIIDGVWTLLASGDTFRADEYFFIQFQLRDESGTPQTTIQLQKSLIAYYVYYWYMRNTATQTTGVGEVTTEPAGATASSSIYKQVFAWNTVVDWLHELYHFLEANIDVYPEYNRDYMRSAFGYGLYTYPYYYSGAGNTYGYFKKINQYNF
jgi:hypothetical protein